MKRVTDYSGKELVEISDEHVEKLVEIECMVEGVEIVEHPGVEPTFGEGLRTKNFYRLGANVLFPTIEAANEASRLATHEQEYTGLNGKYSAKIKKVDQVQVDTYYDYDEISAIRADKESFDKLHNQWQNRKNAYDEYCKKRDKAETTVYDAIYDAHNTIGEENKRGDQYRRYLELAEDTEIAGRFFVDMLTKQGWDEEEAKKELERVTTAAKA